MGSGYVVEGIIRPEKFGGIYYERDRLVIEMLNSVGYEILKLLKEDKNEAEIVEALKNEYGVEEDIIKNDVKAFIEYLLKSKYIRSEKEVVSEQTETKKTANTATMFSNKDFVLGMEPYELATPLKVLLELTYSCNLRCIHCFADADYCTKIENHNNELGYEDWCKVIDNIVKNNVFEILLSGGEATMRKDLFKIAEYIQSKGRSYSLLTNATLIDEEKAKMLKRTGCAKVESNLDGYDAETYESFRGVKGSFDKTVKGIQACLNEGIPVRCNVMETKVTVFNLKKIVDKAYEIGVREVCVIPLENGGRAKTNDKLAFGEQDQEKLLEFYKDVNEWFDEKYKDTDMVLFTPNLFNRGEGRFTKLFDIANIMPRCGAGLIHCTINPYGIVKMCPSDESLLVRENNSAVTHDLGEIWRNSRVLKNVRSSNFKKCVHCDSECNRQCPITRTELEGSYEYECEKGA
ncbi:PqqD family peptide modification chaperone [Butyrivibrio fibrisolvens]|uniref:radical SAM protein n=1 Tax=Pseudobutyrivibrio ruminis TaxID=46206 RepID=UPI000418D51E|nr:PqqD family peptide modification chaperone [Pseudobutyrivibrio ruminis]MDC7279314.1 PqqD family peptide modification chaperone [Butyrivibrio fibrisolvens]